MTTSIKNKDTLKQIEELKVFMSTPDTVKMADEDYEEVMRGVLVQRIKDIRKAKRLTQKQLGEMIKLNKLKKI